MESGTSNERNANIRSTASATGRQEGRVTLNGLVLIGGRSTRMGRDKSLLTYHQKPQREHMTDLLRRYCDAVFWSVNKQQAVELTDSGQPLIVDAFDKLVGPLNGIMSAFQAQPHAAWLVVACDMPLLTSQTFDALLAGRAPAKPATAFYDSDGHFPEPLLAIWEPAVWPLLQDAVATGRYSPRQILMITDAHLLIAPDVRELLNINDPVAQAALKHQG